MHFAKFGENIVKPVVKPDSAMVADSNDNVEGGLGQETHNYGQLADLGMCIISETCLTEHHLFSLS